MGRGRVLQGVMETLQFYTVAAFHAEVIVQLQFSVVTQQAGARESHWGSDVWHHKQFLKRGGCRW